MKPSLSRNILIATGFTVAWPLVSSPVLAQGGLEIAYQQGYDEGLRACQSQCENEKNDLNNRLSSCDREKSGLEDEKARLVGELSRCNNAKSGLEGEKTRLEDELSKCNEAKTGVEGQLTSCNEAKTSVDGQLTSCQNEKTGLISRADCDTQYKDKIDKSTCDTEKKTISDQLSSCTTEKNNLSGQLSSCGNGLLTQTQCDQQKPHAYVYRNEKGAIQSCESITPDSTAVENTPQKQCADNLAFQKGFAAGQLSLAGYITQKEVEGKTTTEAVSCKAITDHDDCDSSKGTLKGFKDGYDKGTAKVTPTTPSTQCDPNKISTDPNCKEIKDHCQKTPADCGINTGIDTGIVSHLQAFYKYFVENRVPGVSGADTSFPPNLEVNLLGGINDGTSADQWRYTWVLKQKGCDSLNSGERFKQLKDDTTMQSLCLGQQEDKGTGFGSSNPGLPFAPANQSMGYTVYLMDGETVKATMEIIFSPNSGGSATSGGGGETASATGTTYTTAPSGSSIPTEADSGATPSATEGTTETTAPSGSDISTGTDSGTTPPATGGSSETTAPSENDTSTGTSGGTAENATAPATAGNGTSSDN